MTVRLYRLLPLLVARNASNRQVSSIAGFRVEVEVAIVGKPFPSSSSGSMGTLFASARNGI